MIHNRIAPGVALMLTRRRFLKLCSITGAGLMLPSFPLAGCGGDTTGETATQDAATATGPRLYKHPSRLDRFIDELPVPAVAEPDVDRYVGSDYYELGMSQFEQESHSQLPPTTVWGYQGSSPGPTIEARRGRPVRVKWINDDLPASHPLAAAIDRTIYHGREYPDVRTVAHLHGGFTPPRFDGQPDAWSSPGAGATGERHNPEDFIYNNEQGAALLWYHDHAMASTRLNVYAGLAGLYQIRDAESDSLGLPAGAYEIPLLIQDRGFNEDGSLAYPTQGVVPEHPVWTPFFLGDIPVVNGKAYPFLDVEPRRYRLRLLNGSQGRTYNIRFVGDGAALPFHVIGTDGGFLPRVVTLSALRLGSAERVDVIIDFAGLKEGSVLTMTNDARAPYPAGEDYVIGELMQIRVNRPLDGRDHSAPPESLQLPALAPLAPTPGTPKRVFDLDNITSSAGVGHSAFLINNRMFSDPVVDRPAAGTTEIWEFVNLTLDSHPIHIHLVQFQILNRQAIDSGSYWLEKEAALAGRQARPDPAGFLTGEPMPPLAEESGWKDTALAMPGEVLRLVVPFDLPPETSAPARYVLHCHILEHEDNEMMLPFVVV
ncbi:MAG: multicopper oxidase family protein [Thermoleophilia bacterium]